MKQNPIRLSLTMIFASAILLGVTQLTKSQPADTDSLIPEIQLENVPITTAIEALARQGEIQYLINLKSLPNPEPTVTITWKNISAKVALARLLKEHGLVMVEDKFTAVTQIISTNQAVNVVDGSLLGSDTNNPNSLTNSPIPLISMQDVPLDKAIKNLIEHDHVNVVLDSRLLDSASPTVSIRWKNITASQAIIALCENYDLVIVKDSATGIVRIKPKD